MKRFRRLLLMLPVLAAVSCIRNDIPYPVVVLEILGVAGEGFTCEASDIDTKNNIVTLHLAETTDISRVRIDSIALTEGATASIPLSGEFDLRADLPVVLSLYQDYEWTLRAEQTITRVFTVEGQIGAAEFDTDLRTARVNVPEGTDLNDIRVTELKLGPEGITTMTPAPEELTSFETYRTVDIRYHDFGERWILYVVPTDIKVELTGADAWTRLVWLYAQGRPGTALGFRYRVQGAGEWSEVPAEKVETEGGTFRACLSGLEPLTTYEVVAYSDEELSAVETVTTGAEVPLVNGGFEEWCTEGGIVYPGLSKEGIFWDTGNTGAAIAGATLTDKTSDVRPGSDGQYAAKLESKLAGIAGVGRLAAGNLFVGRYVATRGTNGIVGFGRPFAVRPTALKGWVKYQCGEITDVGTTQPPGVTLSKGDPDNGIIYFALGTWTKEEYGVCEKEEGDKLVGTDEVPICVDTRDRNTFFSPDSPAVVAYGELVLDRSVTEWQEFTIKLDYRATDIVPTHIVLVCSASRYGDYYTGSRNSILWVDDFELVYDE